MTSRAAFLRRAEAATPEPHREPRALSVALAGNPNCGKTSVFNALTGGRQRVGNYAGVTVEKRSGTCLRPGLRLELLDLPGTYSLASHSPEEWIAQEALLHGEHDVVVVVVDSTTLKRGLGLLAQIMLTGARPVLCLNMADEAREAGQYLDIGRMELLLGCPVVETVGHRGLGLDGLVVAIHRASQADSLVHRLVLGERLDRAIAAVSAELGEAPFRPESRAWVACSLLVGAPSVVEAVAEQGERGAPALRAARREREILEAETGTDAPLFVAECQAGFVDGLLREVVVRPTRADARATSNRIDDIVVHRWLGLPVFAAVMYAIFWLTFSLGQPLMDGIEAGCAGLGAWMASFWPAQAESPLRSLLVDGIIGGVGGVLVFLPNIALLFAGLAFLEDTGYMARAAFLMDRVMRRFGLHGKSFLPMLTGFGCSIPGIMATRTIGSERDRLTTMLVLPLVSCGARLPIWMLLIPAVFAPAWRAPMLWLIYATGIALALGLSLLLRRTLLRGEEAPFVMELPPYRLPTVRAVALKMAGRSWFYLRKAGTVILGTSILLWALAAYPKPETYQVDADLAAGRLPSLSQEEVAARRASEALRHSLAGRLGRALEPLLRPVGFDWKLATAMVGAFAAKEVFVAQMGIVYSMGEVDEGSAGLREALSRDYSPLVGLSLMLFLLIGTPCMATFAVTRQESGGTRWALLQLGGLTAIAYLVSLSVYQVGRLLL
jgi:ferrous iron transport protein B